MARVKSLCEPIRPLPAADDGASDARIAELLEQYSIAARSGNVQDPESFIARHPEYAESLRGCFQALTMLHRTREQIETAAKRPVLVNGEVLGDYRVEREIGRGSMGVVYLATQQSLRRRVALKVLSPPQPLDRAHLTRFRREAMAAASLDHDHIVPVHYVDQIDRLHFYVMRWIDGCSLADLNDHASFADQAKRVRDKKIASMLADAADAIGAAHEAGIVHRDIKPSNLLVDQAGKTWVSDFGLARIGMSSELTCSGDLVGTLRYMSPEQAAGRIDQVDGASDIYALGATLYEIVSRVPVFDGEDGMTLLRKIQSEEPTPVRKVDPDIDRDLATIIERAMRPDRPSRYASSFDLANDLRRYAAGETIRAARVTTTERTIYWTSRHAAAVLSALLISCIGFLAALAHNRLLSTEQQRTAAAYEMAQGNYRQARDAVDRLGSEFAARLSNVPAAREIRRDLLAETLAYYERFIASQNDTELAADVARTHLEIARVISRLDQPQVADQAYAKAIQSLAQEGDAESNELRVQAINERAMLRSNVGDHHSALQLLRQIDVSDPTAALGPYALALTHNHLAIVHFRLQHISRALAEMESALKLLSNSSAEAAETTAVPGLAAAMNNLAAILSEAGRDSDAMRLARRSAEMLRTNRSGDAALRQSAVAQSNLATILARAGKHKEAIQPFRASIEAFQTILARTPTDSEARCQLAVAQNNLGMTLAALDWTDRAEATFRQSESSLAPLLENYPDHAVATRTAAGIKNNLEVLLRHKSRTLQAD